MMVWYCGWNTTFKEKLPKTAGEPATGSTPARGMESKNKFFLCMGKKKTQNKPRKPTKTAWEKPPLTTQSCSDLGPGRGGTSRSLSCSLPPKTRGRGVGGQRGGGLSVGCTAGFAVCSSRLTPIANCCHSQEEGGGQEIMTQVLLGWYSLQGCFLSWGSPCPTLPPGPRSAPIPHGSNWCSTVLCTADQLSPRLRACGSDSDAVVRVGAHGTPCDPARTHAMLQPSVGMQRVVPPCTAAWHGRHCFGDSS